MAEIATLLDELESLYHRQADLRAYELDLADRGENDPASDTWKIAATIAAGAEADFQSALVRNWPTIARVLREAAEGWNFDMDAAPRDGRRVLLAWSPQDVTTAQAMFRDGRWVAAASFYDPQVGHPHLSYREFVVTEPFAWHHLPAPPSETGNG